MARESERATDMGRKGAARPAVVVCWHSMATTSHRRLGRLSGSAGRVSAIAGVARRLRDPQDRRRRPRARRRRAARSATSPSATSAPAEFRIPAALEQGIVDALRRGETNYPPSDGIAAAARGGALALRARARLHSRPRVGDRHRRARGRASTPRTARSWIPATAWCIRRRRGTTTTTCTSSAAEGVPVPCDASMSFLPTRRAGARGARRAAARALLAAESLGHGVHGRRAARDLRAGGRGECAARRGRAAAVPDVRPGVLDAHLRRHEARASRSASVPRSRRTPSTSTASPRRSRPRACAWAGSSRRPTSPVR